MDCDQIQAAVTTQYNTNNQQDMAGIAQELGVSQNQVLACLGSIAAGRNVNINTAAPTTAAPKAAKAAKAAPKAAKTAARQEDCYGNCYGNSYGNCYGNCCA